MDTLPVLVVDDQAPFRSAAKAVVGRMDGFSVVGEATDGEEAVAMAAELHPALVLMDINMPGMNGVEA
ncbi:MAG TPA: response regulator transcription factor, partial [Acidimicrobiales bacterium]